MHYVVHLYVSRPHDSVLMHSRNPSEPLGRVSTALQWVVPGPSAQISQPSTHITCSSVISLSYFSTMATAHAHDVYAEQLFKRGEGYPLWAPEATEDGEVLIGDVGYVRRGAFYRMFNAMREGDDEINKTWGVPDGFKEFTSQNFGKRRQEAAIDAGALCSKSVRKISVDASLSMYVAVSPGLHQQCHLIALRSLRHGGGAGFHFECTDDQGAILVLKDSATREEMHPSRKMKNYMFKNIQSWHSFAVDKLDVEIELEGIMFVRGWVKTTEWAVAAVLHEGRSAKVSFNGDFGLPAEASFEFSASQEVSASYAHRSGPPRKKKEKGEKSKAKKNSLDAEPYKADQCVFLHYYKLKKRRFFGPKRLEAAAEPRDPSPSSDDEGNAIEAVPAVEKPYDPVQFVLDYILDHSQADAAIASDRDIIDLCNGSDIPDNIPEFLENIQPHVEVNDDGLGMLLFDDAIADRPVTENTEAVSQTANERPLGPSGSPPDVVVQADEKEPSDDDPDKKPPLSMIGEASLLDLPIDDHRGGICALAYSPDGRYIASGFEDSTIIIWDPVTRQRRSTLQDHFDTVCSLAFSPDSTRLVSGSRDKRLIIWDVASGQRVNILEGHQGFVDSVAYSPDGNTIASASVDFTVRLWDAHTGIVRSVSGGHNAMVMLVTFSPDGRRLVSASADCIVRVWNTSDDTQTAILDGHQGVIYSIAFSPDGRRIVTGSDDATCRIWSAETGEEFATLREHMGSVWAVTFSPDGKRILSVASDRTVKICDSFSGSQISSIDGSEGLVNAAAFSADGEFVCAGAEDHSVRVWNTSTGKHIVNFEGHTDSVSHLRFSPDGKHIVSASDDGTVRLWNLGDIVVG
ncbi:hypothetical protein AcV7_003303 [Taiwanofungus camphoratus]|nr:hypothetical protein AcV7_003303 [Antrodia cinnamomea]